LLQPYGLFTGLTLVVLCAVHGATFIALKTTGDLRARASRLARNLSPFAALILLGFVIWTHHIAGKGLLPNPVEIAGVLALFAAVWLIGDGRDGWSFAATTIAVGLTVLSIFSELYPRLMVSSTNSIFDLTIHNSASPSYSLRVMTVVALILLPVVLAYTAWTYYVFRRRLSDKDFVTPTRNSPERPSPGQKEQSHDYSH
jgi:cytochrome bd ubiquinol oxidase subunit II